MLNLFSLKINLDFNNLKFTFAAILCNKGDPKICLKKRKEWNAISLPIIKDSGSWPKLHYNRFTQDFLDIEA